MNQLPALGNPYQPSVSFHYDAALQDPHVAGSCQQPAVGRICRDAKKTALVAPSLSRD